MAGTIYTDFGLASDAEFFDRVVRVDMDAFRLRPGVVETFHIASSLNHMLDWHWHSLNRGKDKSQGTSLKDMRDGMAAKCPELKLVRDICDGSKHCGLNRSDVVLNGLLETSGRGGVGGYGCGMGYGVAGAYGRGTPEIRLSRL